MAQLGGQAQRHQGQGQFGHGNGRIQLAQLALVAQHQLADALAQGIAPGGVGAVPQDVGPVVVVVVQGHAHAHLVQQGGDAQGIVGGIARLGRAQAGPQGGGNVVNALGLGGVDAKVLLQGEDFGSLFVRGRLMLQQIVQQALAQGTVGDFQLGNVQLLHHGQHDADAAGQHRAALFLEGGQAQLVNVARLQQQRFQVVQLVWGDNVAIHPQGGEDIPQRMGRAR